VPLITPVIFFNLIMQMVHAFQEFNGPYLPSPKAGR
jgi:oligogalacturonide transport system permease protein